MGTPRSFEFRQCLGRGGQGEAYRAAMTGAGGLVTDVVVKLLHADLPPGGVRRLRDEGRALARLTHPNIVRVVDLVDLDGRAGLVTEHVPGIDVSEVIGQLSPRAAAELTAAVATALEAAAKIGIVHRDIKPGNVRIGHHGEAKLLDFGFAYTSGEREAKTASNVVIGSIPYLAPERFVDRRARHPADVFGLGAMLYELLVAERLHEPATLAAVSERSADPERWLLWLDVRLRALPAPTRTAEPLLRRLLAWDPDDRPTARAAADALDALGSALPGALLRSWARDRDWTERGPRPGPLEGRVLTEQEPDDISTEPARPAGWVEVPPFLTLDHPFRAAQSELTATRTPTATARPPLPPLAPDAPTVRLQNQGRSTTFGDNDTKGQPLWPAVLMTGVGVGAFALLATLVAVASLSMLCAGPFFGVQG